MKRLIRWFGELNPWLAAALLLAGFLLLAALPGGFQCSVHIDSKESEARP